MCCSNLIITDSLFLWIQVTVWCHFFTVIQLCSQQPLVFYYCRIYYIFICYSCNVCVCMHIYNQLLNHLREGKGRYMYLYCLIILCLHLLYVLCFFMWIWFAIWGHLLYAGRTSFIISCKVDLLGTNYGLFSLNMGMSLFDLHFWKFF